MGLMGGREKLICDLLYIQNNSMTTALCSIACAPCSPTCFLHFLHRLSDFSFQSLGLVC